MRIHIPIPIFLQLFPVLTIIFVQCAIQFREDDFSIHPSLWTLVWVSSLGSFLTRSIGCIINDYFDQDIDKKTDRTKSRPLTLDQNDPDRPTTLGIGVLFGTMSICALLLALKLGKIPALLAICSGIAIIFYPLTKRVFFLPQLFLGLVYSMGIVIICSAVDGWLNFTCVFFYLINVLVTFSYDTIYAKQDLKDDIENEIQSSALTLGQKTDTAIEKIYNVSFIGFFLLAIFNKLPIFCISVLVAAFFFRANYKRMMRNENFQGFFDYNVKMLLTILIGAACDSILFFII